MTGPRLDRADVVVVGAGVIGLAAAWTARQRGLSVVVVERNPAAVGASVRNFGHICTTAQDGITARYAEPTRRAWLELGAVQAVGVAADGAVVAARTQAEMAVLGELHDLRGDDVRLLSQADLTDYLPSNSALVGGAFFPRDLRVDPRLTVSHLAQWLASEGVRFYWNTTAGRADPGVLLTSRGVVDAKHVVIAVGHDVDRLLPDVADEHGVQRCQLAMLSVASPVPNLRPTLLSGLSMLRYPAFAACPSLTKVRAELEDTVPAAVAQLVNLMMTQQRNGDLIIGDTHRYLDVDDPFAEETLDALVLDQAAQLLGVDALPVRQRWRGVYASAPEPYLHASPYPDVTVLAVTTGLGMTTGFGFVEEALSEPLTRLTTTAGVHIVR